MKAIKQKKYRELICELDENLDGILIYGSRNRQDKNDLVCFYTRKKGFEALYHLKSVLTNSQIKTIRGWIAEFNPKFEVQI